ncbi:hypothetical protein NUACC26_076750 [Scytonema sp. NUACC26]
MGNAHHFDVGGHCPPYCYNLCGAGKMPAHNGRDARSTRQLFMYFHKTIIHVLQSTKNLYIKAFAEPRAEQITPVDLLVAQNYPAVQPYRFEVHKYGLHYGLC